VARAEDWLSQPIRVISPFAAGSASDTVGRVVLERLATARSAESFGKFVKNDRASTVQLAKDAHIEPLD